MSRARDLADSADKDIAGTLTVDGLVVDTDTLYVDATNNRVGIGTTSPSNALTVDKDTGSTPTVYINNSGSDTTDGVALKVQASGRGTGVGDASIFSVHNNSSEIFTVRNDGNIGIGTTSPSVKLDVEDSSDYAARIGSSSYYWELGSVSGSSPRLNAVGSGASATFFVNSTERMRIDSSGNVGIGTDSPSFQYGSGLEIEKSGSFATLKLHNTAVTEGFYLIQDNSGTAYVWNYENDPLIFATNASEKMRIDSSGNVGIGVTPSPHATTNSINALEVGPAFNVYSNNSPNSYLANNWYLNSSLNPIYKETGYAQYVGMETGKILFNLAPSGTAGTTATLTQAMTLDASGNLLLGDTSALFPTNVRAVKLFEANIGINHNTSNSSGDSYVRFGYSTNTIGSITQSGTTAVLYNTTSDERLKENIQDADSAGSVIDNIQVRQYDWIADGEHQRYGMIAQELNTVAPEAVTQGETENDMWAVDYSKLVPMLVKEIQDLRKRVADLEGN